MSFEQIRERYLKNYISEEQLIRFRDLGIITQVQYELIYYEKHGQNEETVEEQLESEGEPV